MARVTVNDVDKYSRRNTTEFFKLENDQDTAVVRFILNSIDDIDVLAVHEVEIPGMQYKRKVSCLKKDPNESNENCPLCNAGELTSLSVYLQMLVYEQDENGYYTKQPKQVIWERGKSYLKKLTSICNRYCTRGKRLIDTVFEIQRNGKRGDKGTSYDIYPFAGELEADECPIPDEIDKLDPLGTIVMDKSFEDLQEFINTGNMPESGSAKNSQQIEESQPITRRESVQRNISQEQQITERPARRRI